MNGLHRGEKGVDSPPGIGLAKTKSVSGVEKQQENRSDSIERRRFQVLPPGSLGGSLPLAPSFGRECSQAKMPRRIGAAAGVCLTIQRGWRILCSTYLYVRHNKTWDAMGHGF